MLRGRRSLLAGQSTAGADRARWSSPAPCSGRAWGAIPGLLRAFLRTNEIITSLMLNYVAALVLNYLIFDSLSYWRDTSRRRDGCSRRASHFRTRPPGRPSTLGPIGIPFGFLLAVADRGRRLDPLCPDAVRLRGAGDRRLTARRALRRHAHAAQDRRDHVPVRCHRGDRRRQPDRRLPPRARRPRLQQANYGYAGIVVAALARYNPFAVVLVAFLLGGLQNAGYTLQSADFPSGLVGVMQGMILFAMLGGELLVQYRITLSRPPRRTRAARRGGRVNNSIVVVVLASAIPYGTPLLYAALGELLAERSGVLNLGVEGMMLVGAVMGFLAVQRLVGRAGLVLARRGRRRRARRRACRPDPRLPRDHLARQPDRLGARADDLRRAAGLSSYIGNDFDLADIPARTLFAPVNAFGLAGPAGRRADPLRPDAARLRLLGPASSPSASTSSRTRPGLNVRAVGESPAAADAMGINVDHVPLRSTRSRAARSQASAAPASASRSRRNGWTG